MSSSDKETPSPELGASSSNAAGTSIPCTSIENSEPDGQASESSDDAALENSEKEEQPVRMERTFKKARVSGC
jgi:hypothetical protein